MTVGLSLLTRIRFLLPFLALLTSIYSTMLLVESGYKQWVLYDYAIWIATFLVCLGVYVDIRFLGKKFSFASTLLLSFASAVTVITIRITSLFLNLLIYVPDNLIPLFGSSYSYTSFLLSTVGVISSSTLAFIVLLLHSVLGRPIVIHETKPFNDIIKMLWTRLSSAQRLFENGRFYLIAAFLTGFLFRLIPEIIWWPWPIGYDTIEYIAHLMDFMERLNPFASYFWMGGMRNCPPLLNILLLPPALIIGAWNAFKIYPPVAYGLLTLSSALLAGKVFGLDQHNAFFASAITAFYILNLRISWDYQRQLLGSIFMLLTLVAVDSFEKIGLRQMIITIVLMACCALSHEVTALFSAAVSLVLMLRSIKNGGYNGLIAGFIGLSTSVLLEAWYWRQPYTQNTYFGLTPIGVVSYSNSVFPEVLSYLIVGYSLTLPFALLTILNRESGALHTRIGFATLLIAGVSPMIAPYTSVATWYRFLIGAAPIASTLAGVGVASKINNRGFRNTFLMFMLLLAFPYTYGVNQTSRFVLALKEFPGGITPSPMETSRLNDLKEVACWIENRKPNSTIAAENYVARWIHLAIRNPTPKDIVYMRPVSVESVKKILDNSELNGIYVVCDHDLEADFLRIEKIREGPCRVYFIRSYEQKTPR